MLITVSILNFAYVINRCAVRSAAVYNDMCCSRHNRIEPYTFGSERFWSSASQVIRGSDKSTAHISRLGLPLFHILPRFFFETRSSSVRDRHRRNSIPPTELYLKIKKKSPPACLGDRISFDEEPKKKDGDKFD